MLQYKFWRNEPPRRREHGEKRGENMLKLRLSLTNYKIKTSPPTPLLSKERGDKAQLNLTRLGNPI
jgi:hypothetical protein